MCMHTWKGNNVGIILSSSIRKLETEIEIWKRVLVFADAYLCIEFNYEVIRIPNSVWSFLCCFVKDYITQRRAYNNNFVFER